MQADSQILSVKDLRITFLGSQPFQAVAGIDLSLARGETLVLLGESGSGKSVTLKSLLRLLPEEKTLVEGSIEVGGRDILKLSPTELRSYRADIVSMIFQDPVMAFDPMYKVGDQLIEVIREHKKVSYRQAFERALELFELVRIPSSRERLGVYPHEMSGGMRQRAMIAIALSCDPQLLLADEPTTALDTTVQMQILLLLKQLQRKLGLSILFVTHDIGVAVELADRIAVMQNGAIVEIGECADIISNAQHPYTQRLLKSRESPSMSVGSI